MLWCSLKVDLRVQFRNWGSLSFFFADIGAPCSQRNDEVTVSMISNRTFSNRCAALHAALSSIRCVAQRDARNLESLSASLQPSDRFSTASQARSRSLDAALDSVLSVSQVKDADLASAPSIGDSSSSSSNSNIIRSSSSSSSRDNLVAALSRDYNDLSQLRAKLKLPMQPAPELGLLEPSSAPPPPRSETTNGEHAIAIAHLECSTHINSST